MIRTSSRRGSFPVNMGFVSLLVAMATLFGAPGICIGIIKNKQIEVRRQTEEYLAIAKSYELTAATREAEIRSLTSHTSMSKDWDEAALAGFQVTTSGHSEIIFDDELKGQRQKGDVASK
jgi:hypothetical protein